jgi:hypothetical protein
MLGLLRHKQKMCYAKNRVRHPQHTQHLQQRNKGICIDERSSFHREQKIPAQKAKALRQVTECATLDTRETTK